jgi:hypothetical protein
MHMSDMTIQSPRVNDESPVVWGAKQIGEIINRPTPQVHYMLAAGQIQSAKKVGKRWMAGRAALLREFGCDVERQHDEVA